MNRPWYTHLPVKICGKYNKYWYILFTLVVLYLLVTIFLISYRQVYEVDMTTGMVRKSIYLGFITCKSEIHDTQFSSFVRGTISSDTAPKWVVCVEKPHWLARGPIRDYKHGGLINQLNLLMDVCELKRINESHKLTLVRQALEYMSDDKTFRIKACENDDIIIESYIR